MQIPDLWALAHRYQTSPNYEDYGDVIPSSDNSANLTRHFSEPKAVHLIATVMRQRQL